MKTGTTRDGFGIALHELGSQNAQVVALCGDLTESMRVNTFAESFSDRFFQMGVQEENLVGVATGLSLEGKIPFACSYSVFLLNNAMGPIRASVCYTNANVKLVGGHAGITTGPDGATHQALEDIALMRSLPNMTVVVPADQEQARLATHAVAKKTGPCYIRVGKYTTPDLAGLIKDKKALKFTLGKAQLLHEGSDITVVTTGNMTASVLMAAQNLCHGKGGEKDICADVINVHTIKPLDTKSIFNSLKKTRALLIVEEHQITAGLGSAVLEAVSTYDPSLLSVPALLLGIPDTFGQSGSSSNLLKTYHLSQNDIELAIKSVIQSKKSKRNSK